MSLNSEEKYRPLIRIGVFHLIQLDGITAAETKAIEKIRMGLTDPMQAVFDGECTHLKYHLIAEVDVRSAEEAVRVTMHDECSWVHGVEVHKYYPTQTPARSTRIGDVLKIGMHYMAITTLDEGDDRTISFPAHSSSAPITTPTVTFKKQRSVSIPAASHVWREKKELPDVQRHSA